MGDMARKTLEEAEESCDDVEAPAPGSRREETAEGAPAGGEKKFLAARQDSGDGQKLRKPPPPPRRPLTFKVKEFHPRESLLTQLFESSTDAVTAYNFFAALFVLLLLRALLDDIATHGLPFHHLWLVWWNFAQLPATLAVWLLAFLSTFIPFTFLKYWAHAPAKSVTVTNQLPLLVLYISYLVAFFYFPLRFLFTARLNCACSFIITCETTRIAMKTHSFIRENAARGIALKLANRPVIPGAEGARSDWPSLEQFVYFFFCPSFIYRDSYPRTTSTNWRKVAGYAAHVFLLIEYVNLVFTQMVRPWLLSTSPWSLPVSSQLSAVFSLLPAGWLCLLCLFYGLLHCWLNMFAEVMRFADRDFYANWWNAANMAEYYRNWNLVVHDWLYAYIFRDVTYLLGGSRRALKLASSAVFFTSAFFHEYWFGVALRILYPVMFLLYFVAGGVFFSVSRLIRNRTVWNVALYFNLLIGTGMFVAFYGQLLGSSRRALKLASSAVFFTSTFFHEYWFGVALRILYPVMFLLYFVARGVFFSVSRLIRNRTVWNVALYFNLLIGTGMFVAFYGQEWYARERCAPYDSDLVDMLLPRHWACKLL